jgi:hypothetical protein
MNRRILAPWGLVGASLLVAACGGAGADASTTGDPTQTALCNQVSVDRFKELIVVDPAVVGDARSRNDANGPWSFRHLIEEMAPPGVSPSDFAYSWLSSLTQPGRVNLFDVPRRERANELLICPWLRATPENGCDDGCSSCASRSLDLAKAPFRLIALSNRTDLSQTDEARNSAGESRLIFALTRGPGDDPASPPYSMSLIFEYQNPTDQGRDTRYWARRWHALGAHETYDASFLAELEALYADITSQPADRPSWINQVRTNDIALDWVWEMREFKLVDGALRVAPTQRTPDKSLNGSQELARFVFENKDQVLARRHILPSTLNGGFVRLSNLPWRIPGVDETTRLAFARETCDGCHQTEQPSIDQGFHVSPLREGVERFSVFLNNPADPDNDELGKRERFMQTLLCEQEAAGARPY